jgi:hypothetical protein
VDDPPLDAPDDDPPAPPLDEDPLLDPPLPDAAPPEPPPLVELPPPELPPEVEPDPLADPSGLPFQGEFGLLPEQAHGAKTTVRTTNPVRARHIMSHSPIFTKS